MKIRLKRMRGQEHKMLTGKEKGSKCGRGEMPEVDSPLAEADSSPLREEIMNATGSHRSRCRRSSCSRETKFAPASTSFRSSGGPAASLREGARALWPRTPDR